MKVFKRTNNWTGNYLVLGRACELFPEFMRVGDQFVAIAWKDSQEIEFVLKTWFATHARSV